MGIRRRLGVAVVRRVDGDVSRLLSASFCTGATAGGCLPTTRPWWSCRMVAG